MSRHSSTVRCCRSRVRLTLSKCTFACFTAKKTDEASVAARHADLWGFCCSSSPVGEQYFQFRSTTFYKGNPTHRPQTSAVSLALLTASPLVGVWLTTRLAVPEALLCWRASTQQRHHYVLWCARRNPGSTTRVLQNDLVYICLFRLSESSMWCEGPVPSTGTWEHGSQVPGSLHRLDQVRHVHVPGLQASAEAVLTRNSITPVWFDSRSIMMWGCLFWYLHGVH